MKSSSETTLSVRDWGRLNYDQALERQKALVAERIAGQGPDHLVYVEHPPTITLGRSGDTGDLRVSAQVLAQQGVELFRIDRGGRATFHGPGQLVMYPILKLTSKDLHNYLTRLLNTVATVIRTYGLIPEFKTDQPGIWVGGAKIASVGIAVRKWVTYHGIALNVNNDLSGFHLIMPCGQPTERMTTISRETGNTVDVSELKKRLSASFSRHFGYANAATKKKPRPAWLVRPPVNLKAVDRMNRRLRHQNLATVCQSADCPNLGECFSRGTATFMILGTRCTRRCRFCAVEKGRPTIVDAAEPARVAQTAAQLGLRHVVVTSVTRDDLQDGGSRQFAATIHEIRERCEHVCIEVLVPDFKGNNRSVRCVCQAEPDVFNHNIETVPRLYSRIRPGADYSRSLAILSYAFGWGLRVKSGLMLGLGESEVEVRRVLWDLRSTGCNSVTIGQYLAPSPEHFPMVRYVPPAEFEQWEKIARALGFESVASAPLVRSSYRAEEMMASSALAGEANVCCGD